VHPVLFHIGAVIIPSYGAMAAVGVLLALYLAQRTARTAGLNPAGVWNLCVIALFAALAGQRLLLVLMNWTALRAHPSWMLALAMVHHPLLASAGAAAGGAAALVYALRRQMPLRSTADVLAAPMALGLAFEQLGALLAGSGWGADAPATLPWAVTYTSPLAARWSGVPLGIPLHPVQAYAALVLLALAGCLLVWLPRRRQQGDVAGAWMMGFGVIVYLTELWRDSEGRGRLLHGVIDGPQLAAIVSVLAGAALLRERKTAELGAVQWAAPAAEEKSEDRQ
jgi:phosphatidylglycerol:prolipoprotein diacylglycerol transferase